MARIKKGDIVARISHGKDIIFYVDKIIYADRSQFAILKGVVERIEADAPIEDLELVDKKMIEQKNENIEKRLAKRVNNCIKYTKKIYFGSRSKEIIKIGKILHLDGDSCLDNKNSLFA